MRHRKHESLSLTSTLVLNRFGVFYFSSLYIIVQQAVYQDTWTRDVPNLSTKCSCRFQSSDTLPSELRHIMSHDSLTSIGSRILPRTHRFYAVVLSVFHHTLGTRTHCHSAKLCEPFQKINVTGGLSKFSSVVQDYLLHKTVLPKCESCSLLYCESGFISPTPPQPHRPAQICISSWVELLKQPRFEPNLP